MSTATNGTRRKIMPKNQTAGDEAAGDAYGRGHIIISLDFSHSSLDQKIENLI